MAFQVKDFVSITASMINWMKASTKRVSDFNVGSVVRTMLESVAAEIDELYQQYFIGLKEAIPVATYNSFNFGLQGAASSTGMIRVVLTPSLTTTVIAAGTTFTGAGLASTYTSTMDTKVAAGGSYIDIIVTADTPGAAGNIPADHDFTLTPSPSNFVSASNLSAFSSGLDEETEDERKLRFASYIASISRATPAALEYGLGTAALINSSGVITERVASARAFEPYLEDPNQPIGLVECYIHNGVGGTSNELVARATEVIEGYYTSDGVPVPGYKAAGVKTPVYAATEVVVPVVGILEALDGYDHDTLAANVRSTIFTYIQTLDIGTEALFSEMIRIVKELEGVYDFHLTSPADNVPVTRKQKLMPGGIDIA